MKRVTFILVIFFNLSLFTEMAAEGREFWQKSNPEQLKKSDEINQKRDSNINNISESTNKDKEQILSYTPSVAPIQKSNMDMGKTMNSLSDSNSNEWEKSVVMPKGCESELNSKLRDIRIISESIFNKHPKDWLNGKYLEFINSKCYLSRIIDLRETTTEDFEKIVEKSIAKKEALLRKMKDEERNSSFINALLIILIPVIIFRLYQRDKEPRKKLPRKEKLSPFWSAFFWWSMWDNQNDKH
ncbi:hypothetical protein [Aliarcobacter butzleri]|uniref:Uncharacterized protein n=1 Tax=Aliarcobacter butzleri TaxID=28197 RepID=A0AAP4PXD9_9BACT|nr:hypothetical protein [Aliarcobacter butzleri]MDN5051689.1 hypothetical protein [Aliarcobacter butzleri]MDN5075453.1 hypothetical protein [Aliarcobacter butzleri]MDN5089944.1 hypothetical protein [Aliarcobacter butzleri]MDN5117686.1 hypothetical protein [Aliarcobacter butzleri]MDN5131724.1 hypothetical protein [Aliarcobacter butzleri]